MYYLLLFSGAFSSYSLVSFYFFKDKKIKSIPLLSRLGIRDTNVTLFPNMVPKSVFILINFSKLPPVLNLAAKNRNIWCLLL